MDMTSIRATITEADRWRRVDLVEPAAQPMALAASTGIVEGDEETTTVSLDRHGYLAVFDPNVGISLVWGLQRQVRRSYEQREDSATPWSKAGSFPHEAVSYTHAELRWNGQPVDQVRLVIVDGGRAYLPDPTPFNPASVIGPNDADPTTYYVSAWQCDVARLVNELTDLNEFDSYLQRSRFAIGNPY